MLQRKSRIHLLCCQKYFRRLYSYRNTVGLNCHFYVMEATFRKQKYVFSKLWLCSSKGGRKDVSSVGPYTRNPFALEGYHWVMLSVLSMFILFPVVFSVAFWSSFAYPRTILYFFYLYLPLKAIRFFCCRIIQNLRGRRKLTFQTAAFRFKSH